MEQQAGLHLSQEACELFLARAGASGNQVEPNPPSRWGFPSLVYSAQSLVDGSRTRPKGSSSYLEVLQQSRTFLSPDCTEAMAAGFGVSDLLKGLRGTLMRPPASEDAVSALRSSVRQQVRSAWSQEAVRRGIAHAKAGETEQALACYRQALELDERNTDALVARGAALANSHEFQRASDDLEAALALQPDHHNAAAYLGAVQNKAAEQGVALRPRSTAGGAGRAGAGREGPPGSQQRQQLQQQQEEEGLAGRAGSGEPPRSFERQQGRAGDFAGPDRWCSHHPQEQQEHHEQGGPSAAPHEPQSFAARQAGHPDWEHRRARSPGGGSPSSPRRQKNGRDSSSGRSSSEGPSSGRSSSSDSGRSGAGEDGEIRGPKAGGEGGGPSDGMDVAQALAILTKHYKRSRNCRKDGKHKSKHRHHHKRKKGKHKHKERKSKRRKEK